MFFDDPGAVAGSSGTLATGQTYDAVISRTGTFSYHCDIHPTMRGTVVVVGAATRPASGDAQGSGNSAVIAVAVATAALAGGVAALALWRRRRTRSATSGGRRAQSAEGQSLRAAHKRQS